MQHIAITDIGNPKIAIKKRIIEFLQEHANVIRRQLRGTFNGVSVLVEPREDGSSEEDLHEICLDISNIGIISFSLSIKALDKLFCKHLNIPTNNSDGNVSNNSITVSHRKFFERFVTKIITCLFPSENIKAIQCEKIKHTDIRINCNLTVGDIDENMFITFSEDSLKYFSNGLRKYKPFTQKEVVTSLKQVPVDVSAILMRTELSIDDLDTISVGDIINLQKPEQIDVKVNGNMLFKGQLVIDEHAQFGVKYE
ncbi:FliM/FliN family flagellar motor switch protein [Vibrio ziniensis]|uniref:FliM/FliN family flagellar motor switch protein n=1 Tax=Vibrio ziniensis TaxID=2711221 RepID=A0A6G7CHG5_9VIBR|nr:FliM/FliN family flagellar motor C-terminal domain-containing protein [Vibrio ziniensis]QIH41476.1 FliM/FliN family flagellar motor switch protein [Vibrio ziniensis]